MFSAQANRPAPPFNTEARSVKPHYHDCLWGIGGKHICFEDACASIADDPPAEGAPFHGTR